MSCVGPCISDWVLIVCEKQDRLANSWAAAAAATPAKHRSSSRGLVLSLGLWHWRFTCLLKLKARRRRSWLLGLLACWRSKRAEKGLKFEVYLLVGSHNKQKKGLNFRFAGYLKANVSRRRSWYLYSIYLCQSSLLSALVHNHVDMHTQLQVGQLSVRVIMTEFTQIMRADWKRIAGR